MAPDPTFAIIALCSIIFFMAATISGFSGFGFALVAVPILTIFLDLKSVVPLEVVLALFCMTVLSVKNFRRLKEPAVIYLFIGMVVGIVVGAWVLDNLEAGVLKKILGAVVILFAVHIYKSAGREREPKTWDGGGRVFGAVVAVVVGMLSGVAGGMFGTSGPPLVVYVDHFAKDKTAFRAQLVVLILLNNIVRVIMYTWGRSILTVESVKFAVWLLPAVILGLFLGSKMHFQVSEKTFGRAIAIMLLVSGALLIIRP
jgi:uncharacterized membrane protein YfcA